MNQPQKNNSQTTDIRQKHINAIRQRLKQKREEYCKTRSDKNILDEQFNPSRPDAVWVSDITYIWTYNGFVYLTSIMDLYSRKIIAWVLSQSLEAIHVVECVNKAKQMRNVTSPLVFHSDRGIQFVSQAFQKVTEGMINSYSKKA